MFRERCISRAFWKTSPQNWSQACWINSCQHFSAGPVHDSNQVHEPSGHWNIGYIACPYLTRMVNFQPPKQIRVYRMPGMPLTGTRLGRQGLDAHQQHQAADAVTAHRLFRCGQLIGQRTASHPGMLQIELVDLPHKLKVACTKSACRPSVVTGSRQPEQLASAFDRDFRVACCNHFLLLRPIKL